MRVFISGGCKNGKSYFAQRLAKAQDNCGDLYYIATMKPVDEEDDERIERHKSERAGWGFSTVEHPVNIENILGKCNVYGSFILDSITALLANEMFGRDGGGGNIDLAGGKTLNGLLQVVNNIKNIVIVSDYIYSDAVFYDKTTERYRQTLAKIDRIVANKCDAVAEAAYSNLLIHKGGKMFGDLYEKIL